MAESLTTEDGLADKLAVRWCNLMHGSAMWPAHGQYRCRTCGRLYPVPWRERRSVVAARPAALPAILLIVACAAGTVRAADLHSAEAAAASTALARLMAAQSEPGAWAVEDVEIEAALPKLGAAGRLQAIRRVSPDGIPEYQFIESSGDRTVRQQVIARYLNADLRGAELPPSSIAISAANYAFDYKGHAALGGHAAYIFAITPRSKRTGLVKGGDLWVDEETGRVVRQSGYLVKSPSVFVKRVNLTRETYLRGQMPEARVTHLRVESRLAGTAELTVIERPRPAVADSSAPAAEER